LRAILQGGARLLAQEYPSREALAGAVMAPRRDKSDQFGAIGRFGWRRHGFSILACALRRTRCVMLAVTLKRLHRALVANKRGGTSVYRTQFFEKEKKMRSTIKIAAFAAIGVGAANLAFGQGPIREGLRATGQAAANVARGVAEGTADVARGVGQAAAGTVRATGDALTPATPFQARGGAGIDTSRDARWRFARHNGEWWYYDDNDQWMYHRDGQWQRFSQDNFQPLNQQFVQGDQFQGQYMSGYRGMDQGFAQPVRHDRFGRAYICENGQAVYLDQGQVQGQPYQGQVMQDQQFAPTPAMPQEHSVARQNLDQQTFEQQRLDQQNLNLQNQQNLDQQNLNQQGSAQLQTDQSIQAAPSTAVPATPAPAASGQITGDASADVSRAPAGDNTSSQAQGEPAAPREINNNPTSQTQGATENPGQ
jgi:hypothetical protein